MNLRGFGNLKDLNPQGIRTGIPFVLLGVLSCLFVATAAPAAEAPKPAAPPKPAAIHYIYLIRHGIYDRDDTVADEVGNGLNELGHEQARLAGERLKALHLPLGRLISSNYTRARETAADIGAALGLPVTEDSLLHECTPNAARADYMANSSAGDIAACEANLAAAWTKYVTPSPDSTRCDVLVCHGNVIRWFAARAMGAETRRWSSLDIANGSLTIVSVGPDGSTKLAVFSDVSHIPVEKQTWTGRGAGWGASRR